jgi:very-short-patch-repair endonuclease
MNSVNFWLNAVGVNREILEGRLFLVCLVCFIVLCVCVARLVHWVREEQRRSAFRAKRILTENEEEFLSRLRRALPECEIWPQVAMGAIVEVTLPRNHPDFWDVRRQFAEKIMDFVVSRRRSLQVVAVVELDDRTHDPKKDAKRDAPLSAVGIRTVRFQSRAKPDRAEIRQQLLGVTS